MSSFKPIDGSKEDFRKYLDRTGVMDALTKVLVRCKLDRPENAMEYLLENFGENLKNKDIIARLESDLYEARNEIEALKRELSSLRASDNVNESINSNDRSYEDYDLSNRFDDLRTSEQ
ncbi:c-Myc-binding protein homolog [Malaya genurostris]|uniref:c-Myc-binding protein homolog n=1 Tax=Malaya genurostris TaxID=325434 RepID=UPI0026F3F9B8|nr:c-Myc-binding protein homolog [Malaya genurostris]